MRRWHLSSSNFVAALRDKLRQMDRSNAADLSTAGLMSHNFKFSSRESLNRQRRRPWRRLPDTSSPRSNWRGMQCSCPDVSRPTKLGFEEHRFNACCLGSVQDLKIGDLVLPAEAKDGTKRRRRKLLQLLDVPLVQRPGLRPLEKRCENKGTVDLELYGESDVVLAEHRRAKPSKCLALESLSRDSSLEMILPDVVSQNCPSPRSVPRWFSLKGVIVPRETILSLRASPWGCYLRSKVPRLMFEPRSWASFMRWRHLLTKQ